MSTGELQAVSAVSLVDQVAEQLRRSIIRGTLGPGQFGIAAVAKQLGVSHIPVREALRRLEAEGLVVIEPSRGVLVRPLRAEDVHGIYRLRLRIEPYLAGLGCPLLDESDLAKLESLLEVYREANSDLETELVQHREFHYTLMRPAASEWDLRVIDYLWSANERYARLLFGPWDPANQLHLEEIHRTLFDAARSRRPQRVEKVVAQHLIDHEVELIEALRALEEHTEDPAAEAVSQ